MRKLIFFAVVFIGVLLEDSITTVPIVLNIIIVSYIVKRYDWIFLIAFFFGILLDVFSLRLIGATSLFFVATLFIIKTYERKFEIHTKYFVIISSFAASLAFLIIFKYSRVFEQAIVSSLLSLIMYWILNRFSKKQLSY